MEPRLRIQLDRVERRRARVARERVSAMVWFVFAVLVVLLLVLRPWLGDAFTLGVGVAVGLAAFVIFLAQRVVMSREHEPDDAVRLVEERYDELDSALLAAAELEPDLPEGRYGFLAKRLIDQVLAHARRHPWKQAVSDRSVRAARGLHAVGALAFAAALLGLLSTSVGLLPGFAEETAPARASFAIEVLPGNAEVEKGRGVVVSAEFPAEKVPGEATLVVRNEDGDTTHHPMSQSLDDPVFAVRLKAVDRDVDYEIQWRGERSESYRLSVFEHPELRRSDVVLRFPDYTGLAERRIEDTRRVTAPEGTQVTVICRLNKPVASAALVNTETDTELVLIPHSADPLAFGAAFTLKESLQFEVALTDDAGRRNKGRPRLVFRVTENRRPDMLLTSRGDVRVSPLEEVTLAAKVEDDFGVQRFGLGYRVGGGDPVEVVLGAEDVERVDAEHTIALEELEAEPAQLVSYHFWAEDLDAAGEVRRTTSDLLFAEVRELEEVFREAQQQPGGGGEGQAGGEMGGGGGLDDLVQMQRDVVLATWNVIRREADGEGALETNTRVVRDAQGEAKDRLDEVAVDLMMAGGAELQPKIEAAGEHMDAAVRALDRALAEQDVEVLSDALPHEQDAYQALLTLRDSEFNVTRGQSSGPPGSSRANATGGPSQEQLRQLELTTSENRYETERQAQAGQDQARETRQALSRLKELAQRQRDLNERLRELQSELQAAQTEEEREELRRRLKRLQESQEEILRDTDELRQRAYETSQEQLAEQREQLDRTRENVRRASEALEEGRLSQALTEGSRARREMEALEEELRDAAGGQFGERLREMQREAQRIEEEQERLAQDLREQNEASRRSLREDPGRDELERAFEQQEEDVAELLRDVEDTVQEAEEPEPLLAEELFDTLGEARQGQLEEAFEVTRELLEGGFPREAQETERVARAGVEQLREGIEQAAESVLGSGVEALERARDELERLSEELEGELARAGQPGQEPGQPGEPGDPGDPGRMQPGSDEPGQPGEGQGQPRDAGARRGPPTLTGPISPIPEGADTRGGGGRLGPIAPVAPLTGEDFLDWSDRLRDVEEMIDDSELSAEAARIRSRARTVREDYKRESKEPNWDLVEEKIAEPLAALKQRVAEEVRRRRAEDNLVPIDRDPVPPEFVEDVRRYYERLGKSE